MDFKEYCKNKKPSGLKQICAVLKILNESNNEKIDRKRKTSWVQKSELWNRLSKVKFTNPKINDFEQNSKKVFSHYTTFERLLIDLTKFCVIEQKKETVQKCPICKEFIPAESGNCKFCNAFFKKSVKNKTKENTFYRLLVIPTEIGLEDVIVTDYLFLNWYGEHELMSIPYVNAYGIKKDEIAISEIKTGNEDGLYEKIAQIENIMEKIKNSTLELYQLKKKLTGDDRHITVVSKSTNVGFINMPEISKLLNQKLDE